MKTFLAFASLAVMTGICAADELSWPQYAGNAQHQAQALGRLQNLNKILWQVPIDQNIQYNGGELLWHYTPPLISAFPTVVLPTKTGASGNYILQGLRYSDGAHLWTMSTDWVPPSHDWGPVIGAALAHDPVTPRNTGAFVAASGGTVLYRTDVDHPTATSKRLSFYGIGNYNAHKASMDSNVFIETPFTVDHQGNIYFGYWVTGANAMNLQSGIARINANGEARYATIPQASGGVATGKVAMNCAPALSPDERTIYFAVNNGNNPYLVAADSQTFAPRQTALLKDPTSGNTGLVIDDSTATPLVAPNGDVFYGILENPFPYNNDRGYSLRFDRNLRPYPVAGDFGWDDTPSIVPSSSVPSYKGNSPYLVLSKYNNYIGIYQGDGKDRIGILDPFNSQNNPLTNKPITKEVITVLGVTPDGSGQTGSVREWCVNTACVDGPGKCALLNSEDGKCYRWDFRTNSLTQVMTLSGGLGEAYTSTIIGPDGRAFAISNGILFVVGER